MGEEDFSVGLMEVAQFIDVGLPSVLGFAHRFEYPTWQLLENRADCALVLCLRLHLCNGKVEGEETARFEGIVTF